MAGIRDCETLIIGGGIAGLACARKLAEAGRDFLLITKDIGGRIRASGDGRANYGAVCVGSTYANVLPHVERRRRLGDLVSYADPEPVRVPRAILRFPLQLARWSLLTSRFMAAYRRFQRRALTMSQKRAIEADPYLHGLFFESAESFVKRHRIEDLARSLEPVLYGVAASTLREQTAFQHQLASASMLVRWHEFSFDTGKFVAPFRGKIVIGEARRVRDEGTAYLVFLGGGGALRARNVVVATPSRVASRLLGLEEINEGRNVYVLHLRGTLKERYRRGMIKIFGLGSPLFWMIEEEDGTFIAYATRARPRLGGLFSSCEIIARTAWRPLSNNIGTALFEARQGRNLWLIGDHNITGLEDAYITGLYAASQILRS